MDNIKIGLQLHSVREDFKEDPINTLKRVKAMGYTGVEFSSGNITNMNENLADKSAEFFKDALKEVGLECYGILTSWTNILPENIEETIKYNKEVGSPFLVIGSVPPDLVTNIEEANSAIEYMKEVLERLKKENITTGYHNHDTDFLNVIEGKTFFEHVFDNTPDDFVMLLDTGNAAAGGFDPIELIKKYPNRSPFLHIKGYSKEKGYLAYIGRDDLDWKEVVNCAREVGGAKVFDIEFGTRGDYEPFERAETNYKYVSELTKNLK